MPPPVWAYQVDNFQPPPDEELICSICQAIFCDPVQSPCNHVFCRACIAKWLESNRNCPICRKRTTRSTLQEVVPIVKNMIMKLVLRCHNSERGCKAKFPLESCEAHVKDCQYELVQCKNKPCKQMYARKDIKDHETSSCPHSYVRCYLCKLKISSRSPSHSCIDALKAKLKGKDEKLKVYREKLKKLREELKNVRESEGFTSDSSIDSVSQAEILFNLAESSANLSEFSSISSDESVNILSEDESEVTTWSSLRPTRESMRIQLERLQERIHGHFEQIRSISGELEDNNSSIEYPRASSPTSIEDSSVLIVEPSEAFFEEEPEVMIRPAKRRLVTHFLDSSDEDEQFEAAPQPSRKRTLQHQSETENTSSNNLEPIAGPSYRSAHADSSTSNNDSSPSNHASRFKLRPKFKSRSAEQRSVPVSDTASADPAQNGNPVFERTLSLLEQYNLESDPEWLPPVAGDESDDLYVLPGGISTSTDESSSSDLESESSYEDAAEGRTEDLLNSFYGSSDSDEWLPHY